MLIKFQINDIAKIRSNYYGHILYKTLNNACLSCCEQVKSYTLRPEQIFVEVLHLIDELKEQQKDIKWDKLYRNIKQDYQMQDNIAADDIERIVTAIIYTLASILAVSYTCFYHHLAQMLLGQTLNSKTLFTSQSLEELMDGFETQGNSIAEWMKNYMESDKFESDAFQEYFSPVAITDSGAPQHILFTTTAKSEQRSDFKSLLKRAVTQKKKHGMAGMIKAILNQNVCDEIIILVGTEKDIYNDLTKYYNYTQSYSAFSEASPKLLLKKPD